MNAQQASSSIPVEHIYFVDNATLSGGYEVKIALYDWRNQPETPMNYQMEIMKNGAVESHQGTLRKKGESSAYTFTYP